MNVIQEISRINKTELSKGYINTPASWHAKYAQSSWIYTGNIPHRLTEGDILAVFSQWGEIEDINLVRDDDGKGGGTGKSKGFCFLKYEDARSCVLAVDNFNGIKLLGRSLRVDHVEDYRLPKHLREKEEEEGEERGGEAEEHDNPIEHTTGPGHAYVGKDLANGFDIHKGQDAFAAPPSSSPPSSSSEAQDTNTKRKSVSESKSERKEAKRKRKEARDQLRREKTARKEEREEQRRERRAKRLAHEERRGNRRSDHKKRRTSEDGRRPVDSEGTGSRS